MVMLTAEMDAPVAANGHAAEIDILLGFVKSRVRRPNRHRLFQRLVLSPLRFL
jgi:hypothetical protein